MKTFIKIKRPIIVFYLVGLVAMIFSCNEELVYPNPDIKLPPVPLDASNWEVIDYTSQEDQDGEGANNGRVWNTFDRNPDTFWHSCWNGCTAVPPHYFVIDMKTSQQIGGFNFIQRTSGTRNIEICEIEISEDNATWTSLGQFELEKSSTGAVQNKPLEEAVTARYFKFKVVKVFDGTNNAALAEISPYF
ncbi:discoidin domain-containing protein [Aestuariivivens insulae]|uniref:discoidin domain-containing protein n=1 Tax=Aestuariivivens insulae TaxID=1621988 RepID=UPI001F56F17D|nr:discoidin domain-containing protein [Aestuariivivens insulae]